MADWLIIPLSRLSRTLDQLFLSWRDEIHLLSRRQGEDTHAHRDFAEDGGFLCPSEVKYARPQLAQTSRGVWKYIINMGEHTQTIRMERCLYVVTVLWFYIIERTEFNIFFFVMAFLGNLVAAAVTSHPITSLTAFKFTTTIDYYRSRKAKECTSTFTKWIFPRLPHLFFSHATLFWNYY